MVDLEVNSIRIKYDILEKHVIFCLFLGEEDTNLELKTSTSVTNGNIALNRNTLSIGQQYILRLSAWKDGGSERKIVVYFDYTNSGFSLSSVKQILILFKQLFRTRIIQEPNIEII